MYTKHTARIQQRVALQRRVGLGIQRYFTHTTASRTASRRSPHTSSAAHATVVAAAAGLLLYGQSHGHLDKFSTRFQQSRHRCDSAAERFSRWGKEAPIVEKRKDSNVPGQNDSSHPPESSQKNPTDAGGQDPPSQAERSKEEEKKSWYTLPTGIGDKITNILVPDWVRILPQFISKLQNELSLAPGTLAEQIWWEAHDPESNPEIMWDANVRVSDELCTQEKNFLENRRVFTRKALAQYLNLSEDEIHPDDVPVIAMCGSGGGLRALVAGSSSYLSAHEAGLFDCVTYTAGVSGSCWLQSLFYSSITGASHQNLIRHLKNRLGVHIAYPPPALSLLNSAPTNKYLLSGVVEKLKGTPDAEFGLVDIYGLLLTARLLVPKGELAVDDRDLKVSNQRRYTDKGEYPLPIYTAVRHEIPFEEQQEDSVEKAQERAKKEAWFQWFELTPYEFWCEEFGAGIPSWAMGRSFDSGKTKWGDNGLVLPEPRVTLMMGVWGSAFCATLSHYYKEVRPLLQTLSGFGGIDQLIAERDDDLVKIHPIDPAQVPNFAAGMKHILPSSVPESVFESKYLELMDAGMSNNLPIYPLLRPGRNVDIIISFDASADVKGDNWLKVVDGYARQRNIQGWPIGAGWPTETESKEQIDKELESAQAKTEDEANQKLAEARKRDVLQKSKEDIDAAGEKGKKGPAPGSTPDELSFCNVWIGTTSERHHTPSSSSSASHNSSPAPPSKASTPPLVSEDWQLQHPDAGICVVYFPFLPNPKVPGVDPQTSDFMSTWNFIYRPEEIESVVQLAKANFDEGAAQTKRAVRAVYERKKRVREERESEEREEKRRWKVRLGNAGKKLGQGDHADHFS